MDNSLAIKEMNEERHRCGSLPFDVDERLNKIAEARLAQLPDNGYSDLLSDGSDPLPDLSLRFGFYGPMTQGSVVGGCDPAGLAVPEEQLSEPSYDPAAQTHHSDMINPYWNRVGYANGVDINGIPCSVSIYGREGL